jgi:hypothetical protein
MGPPLLLGHDVPHRPEASRLLDGALTLYVGADLHHLFLMFRHRLALVSVGLGQVRIGALALLLACRSVGGVISTCLSLLGGVGGCVRLSPITHVHLLAVLGDRRQENPRESLHGPPVTWSDSPTRRHGPQTRGCRPGEPPTGDGSAKTRPVGLGLENTHRPLWDRSAHRERQNGGVDRQSRARIVSPALEGTSPGTLRSGGCA